MEVQRQLDLKDNFSSKYKKPIIILPHYVFTNHFLILLSRVLSVRCPEKLNYL